MKKNTVLFEQALDISLDRAIQTNISNELTIIRDFRGRIRILLPGGKDDYQTKNDMLNNLCKELSESLHCYGVPPMQMILFEDDLALEEWNRSDRTILHQDENKVIYLLDRQITGQDWLRASYKRDITIPRATFFGIKGGVGRSTALVIWSWHLANQGKRVIVFDLDLESPGVSSTLLPHDAMPDFGIVDWFIEDGIGQGDALLDDMIVGSRLASGSAGEIKVVPAFGRKTKQYLPKLSRCYSGSPGVDSASWGERLERLVQTFERRVSPDIVLLDSRAGVHDIAAAAVTRMSAFSFLFAVDSRQTWNAYSFLFDHWKGHPNLTEIRGNLQIVASMIPETERDAYLNRFKEHSWDLFRENIYDEATSVSSDAFSFDLNDEEAPHWPLPVFWHRALQEFDPIGLDRFGIEEKTVKESMELFMNKAERLVFPEKGETLP